ncbi:MAG TPA: hypothetical protein VF595_13490 [Tepidisphaeraceae bacterium]|jgi:hypothetical protein
MPTAIRKLGTILFVVGCLAVIAGLAPIAAGRVDERQQQAWLAAAVVGALLAVSGLVTDWLGSQAVREQSAGDSGLGGRGDVRPPAMRLSNRPTGRGFRDDLMA